MPCSGENSRTNRTPAVARARIAQHLDVRHTVLVDAGLIGEQSDALAAHEGDAVRHQDADPRPHAAARELARSSAAACLHAAEVTTATINSQR